jgi:hypothetical protein
MAMAPAGPKGMLSLRAGQPKRHGVRIIDNTGAGTALRRRPTLENPAKFDTLFQP